MENYSKELVISRIISGLTRINVFYNGKSRRLLIKNPSREDRYYANEVYAEAYEKAQLQGLHDNESILTFLHNQGLWDNKKSEALTQLEKNIEEFKVGMFSMTFKTNELKKTRKALEVTKIEYARLTNIRHSYDHITLEGFANLARLKYLTGLSICNSKGKRLFNNDSIWVCNSMLIEKVIEQNYINLISEANYRELARTEPWRTTWNNKKSEQSVFGVPAVDLTIEQKSLSLWSSIYDSIYEHTECPPEDVVNDDDILDGWMIVQKRKRDKSVLEKRAEAFTSNEKIKNSEEIYIPANTIEDARRIDELNDTAATIVKAQRMNYLKKKGEVKELDMPDTKMRFRQAAHERAAQLMTGGK